MRNTKWKKLNDTVNTRILELERELEEYKKSSNNVHFYVAREYNGTLSLWLGKPFRGRFKWHTALNTSITFLYGERKFKYFNLCESDFDNLKWEDEPVEVFLNLED